MEFDKKKQSLAQQELLEQIRFKSIELKLKNIETKKKPLIKEPFKDRDLLRFPSIMEDRKSFDKNLYVEVPAYNQFMSRNYKFLNGDSSGYAQSQPSRDTTALRLRQRYAQSPDTQFNEVNVYKTIDHNKGENVSPQLIPKHISKYSEIKKEQKTSDHLRVSQLALNELKEKRKQKLSDVLTSIRSKSSLGLAGIKKSMNLNLSLDQSNIQQKAEVLKQYYNCTPALVDLIISENSKNKTAMIAHQNRTQNQTIKILNKSLSRNKNTFNSLFPSVEYHKKGDSPRDKHFITQQEMEQRKTLEIIRQNPEVAPLTTDIEKMYFKRDDEIVKSKYELIKLQNTILRAPTPKKDTKQSRFK